MIQLLNNTDIPLTLPMVLTVIIGIFLGSFMDAIAGGGGIVTVPTYVLAGLPMHMALGTNKLSATFGTFASTMKYIRSGYVIWKLAVPALMVAMVGSSLGTRLQLMVDAKYLQSLLLFVLPVVAAVVLRQRSFPETSTPMPLGKQIAIIAISSFFIGCYDGFYGPGTGTFMLVIFTRFAGLDIRSASGVARAINFASTSGAMLTSVYYGQVFYLLALIGAVSALAGNLLGADLVLRKGSVVVRPTVLIVLSLLALKVLSDMIL
ncbi:TSUP family transporter [Bengtsoniella intestinalis]|uniref:sulfite exporter TauE/SafE family protein n=1 Tax=Bengtsoniella intestinalis TaxID=3073143 RepID=UPI00391F5373